MSTARLPDQTASHGHAVHHHPRGVLGTTAAVVAIIRDVLLIVVLSALIYFASTLVNALGDADSSEPTTPAGGWNRQTCEAAAVRGDATPSECDQYFGEGG